MGTLRNALQVSPPAEGALNNFRPLAQSTPGWLMAPNWSVYQDPSNARCLIGLLEAPLAWASAAMVSTCIRFRHPACLSTEAPRGELLASAAPLTESRMHARCRLEELEWLMQCRR